MGCIKVWSYTWWVTFLVTRATCPITLIGVEIQWVANGHCNSKLNCRLICKTPFFLIQCTLNAHLTTYSFSCVGSIWVAIHFFPIHLPIIGFLKKDWSMPHFLASMLIGMPSSTTSNATLSESSIQFPIFWNFDFHVSLGLMHDHEWECRWVKIVAIEKNVLVKETKRKGSWHLSMVVLWIYYSFGRKNFRRGFFSLWTNYLKSSQLSWTFVIGVKGLDSWSKVVLEFNINIYFFQNTNPFFQSIFTLVQSTIYQISHIN